MMSTSSRAQSPIVISSDEEDNDENFKHKPLAKKISLEVEDCISSIKCYGSNKMLSAFYLQNAKEKDPISQFQRATDIASLILNKVSKQFSTSVYDEVILLTSDDSESEVEDSTVTFGEREEPQSPLTVEVFETQPLSSVLPTASSHGLDLELKRMTIDVTANGIRTVCEGDNILNEEEDILPPAECFGYPTTPNKTCIIQHKDTKQKRISEQSSPALSECKRPRFSPVTSPIARAFLNAKMTSSGLDLESKSAWTFQMFGRLISTLANASSRKASILSDNQRGTLLEDELLEDESFHLRSLLGYAAASRLPTQTLIEKHFSSIRCRKGDSFRTMRILDLLRRLNGLGIIRKSNFPLSWPVLQENWFTVVDEPCLCQKRTRQERAKSISPSVHSIAPNEISSPNITNRMSPEGRSNCNVDESTGFCLRFLGISLICEILERDFLRVKDAPRLSIIWTLLSPNIYSGTRLTQIFSWLKDAIRLHEKCQFSDEGRTQYSVAIVHLVQRIIGIVFQLSQNPRDFADRLVEEYLSCYIDLSVVESKILLIETIEPMFVKRKLLDVVFGLVCQTTPGLDHDWQSKPVSIAKIFYFFINMKPPSSSSGSGPSTTKKDLLEFLMLLVNLLRSCLVVDIGSLNFSLPSNTLKGVDCHTVSSGCKLPDTDIAALADSSMVVDALKMRLEKLAGPLDVKCKLKLITLKALSRAALENVLQQNTS